MDATTITTGTALRAPKDNGPAADGYRRWTVRLGTTGQGMDLFEVYQPSMEKARESVTETIKANEVLSGLLVSGFTVHAGTEHHPAPLAGNLLIHATTPADLADTWEDWGWGEAPVVRLITETGTEEVLYVDSDNGMVLVHRKGGLEEHPAEAFASQCECGNYFALCHPEA